MLEIRDGLKQRDNDEENEGGTAEQCSDGEGEGEGGAARSTRDASGGGHKDNETAGRNPAHIRSGSGRNGVGVGVGTGSSSQPHTANAGPNGTNNNPTTSHARRCAFTLFNLSNSCVNANRDGREQPIIFSSNSGLRSVNMNQSGNMNSVYSSLHSCTPTVGALTQATHAPLIHIALNASLLFAPNPSHHLAPSHPLSHSHHWPYPYPFTSYTTPHSPLPILPLGHPFAADTLEARIDTLVRLHCHTRGFSDVVSLAVKLVAHLSIGWHSRYDLYLESTTLFDAIKLSSSLHTRKRMSSEMLHQAQQNSNSSHTVTPDEGGYFVHRSAESSGHALMRSLSEASVISADSTYSVTNSLSTLSASSPPAATHQPLPLQQKTPLSSPLFYAPHELAELRGTSLDSLISAQTFQQFYNTLFPALVAIQDSLFFRSHPSNISAGNGSNAQFLSYPPIPVTSPPSNHPSRSRVDPSLLTNSAAFRAALGLVLGRGIRVCPPPQSNAQQHRNYGSDGGGSAPWYAVGSVIGNFESVLAGGWKRRLVGQPFELFGPRGGGCGLFGLEEVFGRVNPLSFESSFGNGLKTGKRDISGGNFDEPGAEGMDQDEDPSRGADVSMGDEMDDIEMGCRKAWARRNNVTAGGFVALVPIADMMERKTKSAAAEFEDDIRHWKFQQQSLYREQLEKHPQGFSQMHQFRVQPPPSIPARVDIRLEYSPASAYLVSDHGTHHDEVIRLEPDDLDGMVGTPPGYHITHHRAQFTCFGTTSTFPLQKWTMQTGNLSNYHLMLCYGSIEEKNMNEILDIPVDLIEDAVTSHLEHFGPATRALHVLRSLHSSKSAFNLDVDMHKRYRTASERITGSAKGKSKAKYDIVTYENARALLKAMGVFPGDSGIVRCKSEFFWQDETLNTIIQVLLMSSDQFAEYELEPCMLDYNSINAPQSADSSDSSASDSDSETVPQPRANIIPTNNARRRGRLPFREGANEAFLAVFCGILRRRLLMYPTTYLEDLHLMQRMSVTEQLLAQEKDAAGKGGVSSVNLASRAQSPLAKVASSASISAQLGEAASEGSGEHEGKRRRKSHDPLISVVPAPASAHVSFSAQIDNRVSATTPAESGAKNDKEEKLKSCRSDDTLVAGPASAPDASPASSWTETASPVLTPKNASMGSVKHPTAPANIEPAPVQSQQTFTHPSSSHISASTPLEWVSPNRLMVIRFRMCEKRQLHQNIKFLETMVEKYYNSMISRQSMDAGNVFAATNGGHQNPATVTANSGVAVGGYGVRRSEYEVTSGDVDSMGHFVEEDEDDDVSDYSLSDEYSDGGFVSGEMNR
ncbi:hypothetical protein HDU81_008851 [Chytriomyces hyalinus]|nr:hypothetical protein HDU81_008851 [Chytriomyces hyalinus]